MLLLPIALLLLYENILYPTLNVSSGDSKEAYSVIMQQYAAVYNQCELNDDERTLLQGLMNDESWEKYEPHKSDIIKDEFFTKVFEENLTTYLALWVKLGLRYPSQYLNAFFNLTYGYWYPNDILPDSTTYRKYIEVYTGGNISFDSKFPWLLEQLTSLGMNSTYQNLPGISMLFSPAAYVWALLFVCALSFYQKKWKFFHLMLLPTALFLTLLLGPVALLRYLYPIILCVPLFCSIYAKI